MRSNVLTGIGAKLLHQPQDLPRMVELVEDHASGRDPLFEPWREVDAIGKARRSSHLRVDENRHQAHELATVAGGHVVRRAQPAATGHEADEALFINHWAPLSLIEIDHDLVGDRVALT